MVIRLFDIRNKLSNEIKKNRFNVSELDNEYFFAVENILQQFIILAEEINGIEKENIKILDTDKKSRIYELSWKAQMIYKNLNELVLSIATDNSENVRYISDTILNHDRIKFEISNKIAL